MPSFKMIVKVVKEFKLLKNGSWSEGSSNGLSKKADFWPLLLFMGDNMSSLSKVIYQSQKPIGLLSTPTLKLTATNAKMDAITSECSDVVTS